MTRAIPSLLRTLIACALTVIGALTSGALASPVATPSFDPVGGSRGYAPLKVTVRCATPNATVHVTYDGSEPTQSDPEVDSDSFVLVDEPLVLKAKAWLPDGSVSETKTANFSPQPVQGNAVSFVEETIPALMAVGRSYKIAVTAHNIGTLPWTTGTYALLPYRAKDAQTWSIAATSVTGATPTWSDATFTFKVTAPSIPGIYNLRFRMAANGQPFGEPTAAVRVAVLSAADYAREMKEQSKLGAVDEPSPQTAGSSSSKRGESRLQALDPTIAAALSRAQARITPAAAAELGNLVAELQRSPRSFRYLRTRGFNHSDEEFEKLLTEHSRLFRRVRIIRRDENGQRVIPGWPGVALVGKSR